MIEKKRSRRTIEAPLIPEGGIVTWVNEDVSELKTKVGNATHLPFLYPPQYTGRDSRNCTWPPYSDPEMLVTDIDGAHRRHTTIGTIAIGTIPHEIVLKGTGLLDDHADQKKWFVHEKEHVDPEIYLRGLCGEYEAFVDARIAQLANRLGASCAIPLTISRYKKIPYERDENGNLLYATVAELQESNIIPSFAKHTANGEKIFDKEEHVETLVAYARAVETNVRINEDRDELTRAELLRLVPTLSSEGAVTIESLCGFVERAVRRIARTLAILHAFGFVNTEFAPRNVCLSGEITDLSACKQPAPEDLDFKQELEILKAQSIIEDLTAKIEGVFADILTPNTLNRHSNLHDILFEEYHTKLLKVEKRIAFEKINVENLF